MEIAQEVDKFFVVEGATIERLTIVEQVSDVLHHPLYIHTKRCHITHGRLWLCRCICGNEVLLSEFSLSRRKNKSCGCLRREIIKKTETERSLNKQYRQDRVDVNALIKKLRIEMKYEQLKPCMLRDLKKIDAISAELRSAYAKKASLGAAYHKNTKKEYKAKRESIQLEDWQIEGLKRIGAM